MTFDNTVLNINYLFQVPREVVPGTIKNSHPSIAAAVDKLYMLTETFWDWNCVQQAKN